MKIIGNLIIYNYLLILLFVLSIKLAYGSRLDYDYYFVDSQYFSFKDELDQLAINQKFISRNDYLNHKFGLNNWRFSDDHFSFKVPQLAEGGTDIKFSEKLINIDTSVNITVVAEIFYLNKYIYLELISLNVDSSINYYSTKFRLLTTSNIFVVHSTTNGNYLVSETKKIKVTHWGSAGRVRTQQEANKLNAEICREVSGEKKYIVMACEEYGEFYIKKSTIYALIILCIFIYFSFILKRGNNKRNV